jgi:hypothetical protein
MSLKIHGKKIWSRSHLVSFAAASSSSSGRAAAAAPVGGSADRSSKLIINNEISSASERMGAVEKLIEKKT